MKARHYLTGVLVLCLLAVSWVSVQAQTIDSRYFSETGHNVSGDFLVFYESNPNAIFLYGYPITEQFTSRDGKTVQYFQRARFELHAELPAGQRVLLTTLGRETFVSTGPVDVAGAFACRAYSETGHSVCFTFLEFFDAYGGVAQFGYPISSFEYHEDRIVQYFEKARLEWQPWRPEGQRVVVADLGRAYFDQLGEDPGLLPPVRPADNTISAVLKLRVRAFTWKAITLSEDEQRVFVVVQDQNLQPVKDASCVASLHWPDGREENQSLTTNAAGVGILKVPVRNQPPGSSIRANVTCSYNNLNSSTITSFRIWY
jgi:hypothetical protein